MLQRAALALLLLILSGVAALFAAAHFGVPLPWEIAEQKAPAPASNKSDQAATETLKGAPEIVIKETATALGADIPEPGKPVPGGVDLDISRISPDGSSVFAGRAEPDTYVTVLEDGKPAGTVKADSNGEWSLVTDHKFASTDPKLTFESSATPPAEPVPAPSKEVAAATQEAGAAARSAAAVAGEALKKFEVIVSEAREEARKGEQEKHASAEGTTTGSAPIARADAGSASTTAANTASGQSANSGTSAGGSQTTVIPVPITFIYNEATLTSDGKRAADLLLEYLTLKRLARIELTGHADERGTNEYNFDLSRERLETVSQLLRQGGYTGELKLTPKGKTEPYTGVDRTAYRGEALYQLDRRVELRIAQ